VAATPRLSEETLTMGGLRLVQISLNNVARSVTGCRRSGHITVQDLNTKAGFPLLNELVTRTVALETWTAHNSREGSTGARNPLGVAMFDLAGYARHSRAAAAGKVQDRTDCDINTLVSSGFKVRNACADLRVASTRMASRKAAKTFSRGVPL
jgi:hypothetical protein